MEMLTLMFLISLVLLAISAAVRVIRELTREIAGPGREWRELLPTRPARSACPSMHLTASMSGLHRRVSRR